MSNKERTDLGEVVNSLKDLDEKSLNVVNMIANALSVRESLDKCDTKDDSKNEADG